VISAVIFDIDGTLVDSVDLHARAWQETFQEFGKNVTFRQVREQIGKGGDQLLPVFLTLEELDKWEDDIQARRAKRFREHYLPLATAFPHVRELFLRIRDEGKKIALASSAKGDELEAYKKLAQIEDLVEAATSQDDAEKSKPHPDIFKAALTRLGHAPEEVIVVGDTPYDIEAAGKAGIKTIAVRCGGFPEESLSGAIAIYDSPTDLLTNYESSPLASMSLRKLVGGP
jgi:HAD superfamily hydrolase (TIGR01509 family)